MNAAVLILLFTLKEVQPEFIRPLAVDSHESFSMEIKAQVDLLAEEWERHRQKVMLSSKIWDYLDHPAYHKLIKLGTPAIPYIIEKYKKDQLPWGFVLQEITGVKIIQDPSSFSPREVRKQWIEWWEEKKKVN